MGTNGDLSRAGLRTRVGLATLAAMAAVAIIIPANASAARYSPRAFGALDCNGFSTVQHPAHRTGLCTDIRGIAGVNNRNTWGGRFYDNGHYIGHDEPDMTFLSNKAGSGNNVTWTETLPRDPSALPTVAKPGSDVAHWFELSVAPWFSMALCDSQSYPQRPCAPMSDKNAPECIGAFPCTDHPYPGAGSAFMEMQFYPPGFAPFANGISCDNAHWCGALNIDSLACTLNFAKCNEKCVEPVNFAYIQNNGVPTGPPSPQESNLATFSPNSHTLLMNPGDRLQIHMWDAPIPGQPGQQAFKVEVLDLTTGQSGFMQASAVNGFQNTSIADCSGTPHNFQPEYNTAKRNNIAPWTALQTNISTQFEIGHFEACKSVTEPVNLVLAPNVSDTTWLRCHGPYETTTTPDGASNPELSDAPCFPAGDTHGVLNTAPDLVTGCVVTATQNGDLDFDGSGYWPEWPTGPTPTSTFPGSFVQALPSTAGQQYSRFFIQTDAALSESTCTVDSKTGCAIPPPNAPGKFYPYWSRVSSGGNCTIEFGNVSTGPGVNNFGQDAQYGTNQVKTFGYQEFIGPILSNRCT